MLLAKAAAAGEGDSRSGGERRCENSERVFQRKWWGRRVPLEPDPRKMAAQSASPGPEGTTLSGLQLDDRPGMWECAPRCTRCFCSTREALRSRHCTNRACLHALLCSTR